MAAAVVPIGRGFVYLDPEVYRIWWKLVHTRNHETAGALHCRGKHVFPAASTAAPTMLPYVFSLHERDIVEGNGTSVRCPIDYLTFHTHPRALYHKWRMYLGWPSADDYRELLKHTLAGNVIHVVPTVEGLYWTRVRASWKDFFANPQLSHRERGFWIGVIEWVLKSTHNFRRCPHKTPFAVKGGKKTPRAKWNAARRARHAERMQQQEYVVFINTFRLQGFQDVEMEAGYLTDESEESEELEDEADATEASSAVSSSGSSGSSVSSAADSTDASKDDAPAYPTMPRTGVQFTVMEHVGHPRDRLITPQEAVHASGIPSVTPTETTTSGSSTMTPVTEAESVLSVSDGMVPVVDECHRYQHMPFVDYLRRTYDQMTMCDMDVQGNCTSAAWTLEQIEQAFLQYWNPQSPCLTNTEAIFHVRVEAWPELPDLHQDAKIKTWVRQLHVPLGTPQKVMDAHDASNSLSESPTPR